MEFGQPHHVEAPALGCIDLRKGFREGLALALDGRYAPYLEKCFREQPGDVEICKKFLRAAASAYNKKAQPGERVTQYEIQVWSWDFLAYPADPNYGKLIDSFAFEINTGRALREKKLEDRLVKDVVPPLKSYPVKDSSGIVR